MLPNARQAVEALEHDRNGLRVRAFRMADDPHDPILRRRTRHPPLLPPSTEPIVSTIVVGVGGVEQGDERLDVEQERAHSRPSRRAFTSSIVDPAASGAVGRSLTPSANPE